MRKLFGLFTTIRCVSLGFLLAVMLSPSAHALTSTQSIAVPAYEYPTLTNLWPDIDSAGSSIPFVVVNPANGPGASVNSDYTTRIADNTALGIRSIGYVDTNYQARPIADVISDIDQWYSLYPEISGIFIDRVSVVDSAALCYSAYIYNYLKVAHPDDMLIHNFGTYTSPEYEPYGDIFVTAEMDYTLYQTWSAPADGFQDNASNSNRFWHLVHTTDLADYPDALSDSQNNNAGWVYITDDALPNPYDAAASYFSTEVDDVDLLPASTIPNRGITELPSGCLDTSSTVSSDVTNGNTTSTLTMVNNSTTYSAPSPNQFSFTLPVGVTTASLSGTDWTCTQTTCTYGNTIPTSSNSSSLTATFTATCAYTAGSITATATTFPAHTETTSIAVQAPSDCPSDAAPASTGSTKYKGDTLAETGDAQFNPGLLGIVLLTSSVIVLARLKRYN